MDFRPFKGLFVPLKRLCFLIVSLGLNLSPAICHDRYLQDAVELFALCIKHSTDNAREAERVNAYAILGGLLGCKIDILSKETIDTVISLTWKEVGCSSPPPLASASV